MYNTYNSFSSASKKNIPKAGTRKQAEIAKSPEMI